MAGEVIRFKIYFVGQINKNSTGSMRIVREIRSQNESNVLPEKWCNFH